MDENRVYGLEAESLPEDVLPLEAAIVLKCLQADGEIVLYYRSTPGLKSWDRVGMFETAAFHDKAAGEWSNES